MRVQLQLLALVAPLALALASPDDSSYDLTSLKDEHAGQFLDVLSSTSTHPSGVSIGPNSTGEYKRVDGINTYLAYPPRKSGKDARKTDIAILYLTDIYGTDLINNRLLADSLALSGYFVVVPDLFNGEPVPFDRPSFNTTAWRERHPPAAVDAIVTKSIAALKREFGVKKLGAAGYCFGGRYVARHLVPGTGLEAGFTAHPSGVTDEEWRGVTGPLSIAYGELDTANPPAQRAAAESIFRSTNVTFQTSLYSNALHGFATRANLSDPQSAFAQEGALFQALRWFDAWVK